MVELQRCRLWLPDHFFHLEPCGLVGWVNWSRQCLDLVVAATAPFELLSSHHGWQSSLQHLSTLLPVELKGKKPVLLGEFLCSSSKWDWSIRKHELPPVWAEVAITPGQQGDQVFPVLRSLQIDGALCKPDVQMIIYDQPRLGSHHFCSRPWAHFGSFPSVGDASLQVHNLLRQAHWIWKLEEQQDSPNVDRIVLQLNCSRFIYEAIDQFSAMTPEKFNKPSLSFSNLWYFLAALLAALATVLFLFARAGSALLDTLFAKSSITSHTMSNLLHRFRELKAWPVALFWGGSGPNLPDISVVHRLSLMKYTTGVALCMDLLLGAVSGIILLLHRVGIEQYIRGMAQFLTNDILRSGCIWLMGVPAGFKLNTELTGVLGIVSLQVIHTWSTLCYFLAPMLPIWFQGVAISGMFLGLTIHIAVIVDMLLFFTFHLSVLHQVLAFIYSTQLRALASLLRLFRGRKHNPLRRRLDSYNCSVEQIVVASLMFTPLLLLLPTTSGFYMFFTILHVSVSAISYSLQLVIQCIHTFPYAEVALSFLCPQRLPSGIWFKTLYMDSTHRALAESLDSLELFASGGARGNHVAKNQVPLKPSMLDQPQDISNAGSCGGVVLDQPFRLVTRMGEKYASTGEILMPFLMHLHGGLGLPRMTGHIYKVLSGTRLPATLCFGYSPPLPEPSVSAGVFWRFCLEALLHATGEWGLNR